MNSRRFVRFAATLVLASGTMAIAPVLAVQAQAAVRSPSSAAIPQCTAEHEQDIFYNAYTVPPMIVAENEEVCGQIHVEEPATIYKYESGSWVQVATGSGYAYYYCNGSTDNKYEDQAGQQVTAPCV
jgi:hypothetical protein